MIVASRPRASRYRHLKERQKKSEEIDESYDYSEASNERVINLDVNVDEFLFGKIHSTELVKEFVFDSLTFGMSSIETVFGAKQDPTSQDMSVKNILKMTEDRDVRYFVRLQNSFGASKNINITKKVLSSNIKENDLRVAYNLFTALRNVSKALVKNYTGEPQNGYILHPLIIEPYGYPSEKMLLIIRRASNGKVTSFVAPLKIIQRSARHLTAIVGVRVFCEKNYACIGGSIIVDVTPEKSDIVKIVGKPKFDGDKLLVQEGEKVVTAHDPKRSLLISSVEYKSSLRRIRLLVGENKYIEVRIRPQLFIFGEVIKFSGFMGKNVEKAYVYAVFGNKSFETGIKFIGRLLGTKGVSVCQDNPDAYIMRKSSTSYSNLNPVEGIVFYTCINDSEAKKKFSVLRKGSLFDYVFHAPSSLHKIGMRVRSISGSLLVRETDNGVSATFIVTSLPTSGEIVAVKTANASGLFIPLWSDKEKSYGVALIEKDSKKYIAKARMVFI